MISDKQLSAIIEHVDDVWPIQIDNPRKTLVPLLKELRRLRAAKATTTPRRKRGDSK